MEISRWTIHIYRVLIRVEALGLRINMMVPKILSAGLVRMNHTKVRSFGFVSRCYPSNILQHLYFIRVITTNDHH